ncbi:unnamed protein product [Brassica oleracea]
MTSLYSIAHEDLSLSLSLLAFSPDNNGNGIKKLALKKPSAEAGTLIKAESLPALFSGFLPTSCR